MLYRLNPEEQQRFRDAILGGGHAQPGRLAAWARALEKHLGEGERTTGSSAYHWLTYRLRSTRPMLFEDAAKIYRTGLRNRDPSLPSGYSWQQAVSVAVPDLHAYNYGQDSGRFPALAKRPFVPILLPLSYVGVLAEELGGGCGGAR